MLTKHIDGTSLPIGVVSQRKPSQVRQPHQVKAEWWDWSGLGEREKSGQLLLAEENADCEQLQVTEDNLSQQKFLVYFFFSLPILKHNDHFTERGGEEQCH